MIILGINGGDKAENQRDAVAMFHHDAAAAILVDGDLIAAIEEERLNRIKHSNCFPARAIEYCLDCVKGDLRMIDRIVVNSDAEFVERDENLSCVKNAQRPLATDAAAIVARSFERDFGVSVVDKIRFCHHHHAHAWSAHALSGFSESLIFSVDAWGDDCCGMIFRANEKEIEPLRKYYDSIGIFYLKMIEVLGFRGFDEYKAMGLAPYGNKETFASLFREVYRLLPDGEYEVTGKQCEQMLREGGFYRQMRRHGERFTQRQMDFAAALQGALEEIVLHVLGHFASSTRVRNLCLAGGVAHNCTLNGRILESNMFDRVFVQPAASDAGGAIGAAYAIAFGEDSEAVRSEMQHVFLGPSVGSDDDIRRSLDCWSDLISFERCEDVFEVTAQLLAAGKVVGWVQGRSEFGPRALGNRSILADPRPVENKDRINRMIKKREAFRPFAPSVVVERMSEYFELPQTKALYSFMTYVVHVKPEMRDLLGAITHTDGSARLQCVSESSNSDYWHLLNEFGKITDIPILLNTSFNNNVEPIVDSIDDAVTCFLTTELDILVVGRYAIRRLRTDLDQSRGIERLAASMPSYCRLEKRSQFLPRRAGTVPRFAVVHVKEFSYLGGEPQQREISAEAFTLLLESDGIRSIEELLAGQELGGPESRSQLICELVRLWSERLVKIAPPATARRLGMRQG